MSRLVRDSLAAPTSHHVWEDNSLLIDNLEKNQRRILNIGDVLMIFLNKKV